jgi:uncharacterized protein (TIGR02145 family)
MELIFQSVVYRINRGLKSVKHKRLKSYYEEMNKNTPISLLTLSVFLILTTAIFSCKKDEERMVPVLSTLPATFITRTSVCTGDAIISQGSDTILTDGICWGTKPDPNVESSLISLNARLDDLSPNTTYYIRAFATNSAGTGYGNQVSFTTKPANVSHLFNPDVTYDTVTDIDGNIYKTVEIGTQVWMAENLKTSRFNDGTEIPYINDPIFNLEPGFCWYKKNESIFKDIYGGYYNWFAVNTGKLCPAGWHVPTDNEWKVLEEFIGISQADADMMGCRGTTQGLMIREPGTENWVDESISASNASGFTGLPGGSCGFFMEDFSCGGEGIIAMWWTDTELNTDPGSWGYMRWILWDGSCIQRSELEKKAAINVRCIKD